MRAREVFLIMLSHAGGAMSGKTLIQKKGFFLDHFLKLGLDYGPHFYGPYSPQLDAAIGQCKALGFVDERVTGYGYSREGFEVKRYGYELTPDGQIVVEAICARDPVFCSQIRECLDRLANAGEIDYILISIAAKSTYILNMRKKPMTDKEIAAEARTFNWEIGEDEIQKAIGFLEKLGLVTVSAPI